jgi:hypothetical protein
MGAHGGTWARTACVVAWKVAIRVEAHPEGEERWQEGRWVLSPRGEARSRLGSEDCKEGSRKSCPDQMRSHEES